MLFLAYQVLFPFVIAGILLKMVIDRRGSLLRETPRQIRQRLGLLSQDEVAVLHPSERVLWIHAASVGEVNAVAPMIEAIYNSPNRPKILLTTSTVTGLKRAQALDDKPDLAVLAPADFYPFVLAFLRRVRPYALLLIETELWPATLRAAAAKGVRIGIANGRITERAFRRYRWVRGIIVPILEKVGRAAVQTQDDASRFAALGLPEPAIRVCGNLKNDIPAPSREERRSAQETVRRLGWTGPVWAAGSTWPDEEEALLSAFIRARREIPELKLILAPRHMERCEDTRQLLSRLEISYSLLSEVSNGGGKQASGRPDCLVLDRMGMLRELYSACDVAFVGGTLNSVGGHNLLEPAVAAKPVLFGPHTESVQEASRALESDGGGMRVLDALELAAALKKLLSDQALRESAGRKAAQTARHLMGVTRRTLELLSPLLALEPARR